MLAKFINEGKREHEEMEIFIKEFRTTNKLLLKERSNLFLDLKIKVNELSKVMSNVLIPKIEVKGVTTRGGKMTSKAARSKEINETGINKNEPPRFEQDVQKKPHDDGVENKSLSIPEKLLNHWFGVPKALISNKGTHFSNSQLEKALQRYGVTHKLSMAYHPQSNGQTKVTNRAIKRILERLVGYNPKGWLEKLNDALWAFRTAYKTPTWYTPFRLVYGKACHLLVKIEHKAHWALKQCNMDLTLASGSRLMQLNELAELRDGAYENTRIYKEQTKKWHDSRIFSDKDFKLGDQVLLYNSRLKMYPGKLNSKWSGPNIVKTVYPHGAIEITDRDGFSFKVNGQGLKKYYGGDIDKEDDEVIEFENGVT
ncbi:reverse transcriptase domain-containing protein [Tanacetum coccineum]|uniref:Reverse transcriptase domain-containing protein n=1 Tax=Tanacetum coccineum TaxID=301880 RepID=A0ABQ4X768_9ASTR